MCYKANVGNKNMCLGFFMVDFDHFYDNTDLSSSAAVNSFMIIFIAFCYLNDMIIRPCFLLCLC